MRVELSSEAPICLSIGKPFSNDKSAKPGRGNPGNIGVWCNGSTTDFGSVCSSSNLDTLTKALIFNSGNYQNDHTLNKKYNMEMLQEQLPLKVLVL